MEKAVVIGFIMVLTFTSLNGQKLTSFHYKECEENPHKDRMNTRINYSYFSPDSSVLKITWRDNCSFLPKLVLKAVKTDTIYFSLLNKVDVGDRAFCGCAFDLSLELKGLKMNSYNVKINDRVVSGALRRYQTDGYAAEYYRAGDREIKLREMFFENGKIIVEVFYDRAGRIISEKYYDDRWGCFYGERKF